MNRDDELHFSKNYSDQCKESGTGAGFQFDFYCENCRDTWRSPFEPYRSAQAASWLDQATSVAQSFFNLGRGLERAADGLARAGWGPARDEAFRRAIDRASHHFHRCSKCQHYVCASCWSIDRGLCTACAPDVATEIAAARHEGLVYQARENAREAGQGQAARLDVTTPRQLACPECGTATRGAKFCPDCGHKLDNAATCTGCQAPLPAGSRFCPECGTAAAPAA